MTETASKPPIIFYCKDCSEIVETIRCGRKYVYKCKKCDTKNVAFGTEKSIYNFFRLEEKEKKKERAKNKELEEKPVATEAKEVKEEKEEAE